MQKNVHFVLLCIVACWSSTQIGRRGRRTRIQWKKLFKRKRTISADNFFKEIHETSFWANSGRLLWIVLEIWHTLRSLSFIILLLIFLHLQSAIWNFLVRCSLSFNPIWQSIKSSIWEWDNYWIWSIFFIWTMMMMCYELS